MRGLICIFLPFVVGCLSFNETHLAFTRLARAEGVRFYVASLELSDGVKKLPIGGGGSSGRNDRIRRNLSKNSGALFVESPQGAIPVAVTISAHKNTSPSMFSMNAGNGAINSDGAFNDDGILEMPTLFIKSGILWKLTYEIKCEILLGDCRQTVVKPVNSSGMRIEELLCSGVVFFIAAMASDRFHFNGFELFPGMVDDYDWLMEKEFADVMASAVAEFDIDSLKGNGTDGS